MKSSSALNDTNATPGRQTLSREDLDRLYKAATLHGLSRNEVAVVAAVVDAYPERPNWPALRRAMKVCRESLVRAKANLVRRGILLPPPESPSINPDLQPPPALGPLGGRLASLSDRSACAPPTGAPALHPPGACAPGRSAGAPVLERGRSESPPDGARAQGGWSAGAPVSIKEERPREELSLKNDDGAGSSRTRERPTWTPERAEGIKLWMPELFQGVIPRAEAEALADELGRHFREFDFECLKAALKLAARQQAKGQIKSSLYGFIVACAAKWEAEGGVPLSVAHEVKKPFARREVPTLERFPYVNPPGPSEAVA